MKIALYLPTPGGLTGAPRRLLTLASSLREQGIDVCVAGDANAELLIKAQEYGFETLPIEPVGVLKLRDGALFGGGFIFRLRTGLALVRQNLRFRRLVRKNAIDVVWMRGSKGIAFAGLGALLSRRPLVWDVDYELPSRGVVRLLHLFGLWASRSVVFQYQKAPDLIFGSDLVERYSHKFFPIIPGVDLDSLRPFRSLRQSRNQRTYSSFTLLQLGTLCDRKNQLFILKLLDRLQKDKLDRHVTLLLAGGVADKAYVQQLEQLADGIKGRINVEFLGWRTDAQALMVNADLLVMPSKDEGVPNTVQEAMYLGLPVLASPVGGIPEIIEHGVTGWVVPLNESEEWASLIVRFMKDGSICENVGAAASTYAEENFGTNAWGIEYSDIIRACAR